MKSAKILITILTLSILSVGGCGGGGGDGGNGNGNQCEQAEISSGFTLSGDGWLQKGGAPYLPWGLYNVPTNAAGDITPVEALVNVKGMAANTVANPFWAVDTATSEASLNMMSTKGLYGIIGVKATETAAIKSYVCAIKSHPALMAYMLPDEAISTRISPGELTALYQAIKQADPQGVVILVDHVANAPSAAKDAYDVFAYDEYPIGQESIQAFRSLFRDIVENEAPKPVWGILQAYIAPPDWIEPTLAELRSMAYLMLANGAKGLLAYEYNCTQVDSSDLYCLYDHQNLYTALQSLFTELQGFSSILTLPASSTKATASITGLDFFVKSQAGKYYVGAANWLSAGSQSAGHYPGEALTNVTITVSGLTVGTVTILSGSGTGESMALAGGSFTDSFTPYDAKIYLIEPKPGTAGEPIPVDTSGQPLQPSTAGEPIPVDTSGQPPWHTADRPKLGRLKSSKSCLAKEACRLKIKTLEGFPWRPQDVVFHPMLKTP